MDPLDILNSMTTEALAGVDTSFPLLAPGTYPFLIDSAEIKDSEKTGGKYLLFSCKLEATDALDNNNSPLPKGYPVRHMINLSPSQKQIDKDPEGMEGCVKKIQRDIAKFIEAVAGPSREWDPTLQGYRGNTFWAKTRVSKKRTDEATGQTYDPQTEFASFVPKENDEDIYAVSMNYAEKAPF